MYMRVLCNVLATFSLRLIACNQAVVKTPAVHHSPLRQAQEQVLLRALREARNLEPADTPVAVLVFRASADTERISDHIAASRGRVDGGSLCQSADELHLCERSGSGGREGASAGARESRA
jgi:hypothetical protein